MTLILTTPPAITYQVEEARTFQNPYFYECDGKIINLAVAREFFVDHLPMTSFYWPSVRIGSTCYHLCPALGSNEEAMLFLRKLTEKISAQSLSEKRG